MWKEMKDYKPPLLAYPPFHCRKIRHEIGSTENGYYDAAIKSTAAMSYDYTACKRFLECLFALDALDKIKSWCRFTSSELMCLPLGGKLGVKVPCGDWYPPIEHRTKR
ncbi:hypothetical protein TNCV_4214441 [Trichonephila clavipes]|nr:hypothetical protein TNCV_4214441 [Trichonephila clavipes]